jgi:hypothetical protein
MEQPDGRMNAGSSEHPGWGVAFTVDDARVYINEVRWQFAKTMPQCKPQAHPSVPFQMGISPTVRRVTP